MDFSSDTAAPAHPAVIEAIAAANQGNQPSYGGDEVTARLRRHLSETFETDDLDFWLCASGTASNALALSILCSPIGAIACHEEAHIERDERGAPEFFSGGAKLRLLPGHGGQIDETALRAALAANNPNFVHETPLEALSLTNLTECGTAYPTSKIEQFVSLAKAEGLNAHLDGARLANALASTGASPAEMSWKAGIDVLTLGLTKTGAIGCEIILVFGSKRAEFPQLQARAKRSGHMPPKMRFLAAQAEAMLTDNLWMTLAAKANQTAREFADILCAKPGVTLAYPVDGNEVFCMLPPKIEALIRKAGVKCYPWPGGSYRFVCSWTTLASDLEAMRDLLAES
ncbi:MAG: threonine aldolase [Henriciella sp.]|jgi:threonine aldolase|nr:threonine aldolase [Henriciella sp.]MBO6694849.1 threonine aldolase [Henriciella sp.]